MHVISNWVIRCAKKYADYNVPAGSTLLGVYRNISIKGRYSFLKVSCDISFNTQFSSLIPEAWNLSPAVNKILFAEIEKNEKQKWACLTDKISKM